MSDIRLFRLHNDKASAVQGAASHLEKPLRTLIENNLETLLGIRFVASEYSTGKTHAGRIDTLGLNESRCSVTSRRSLVGEVPEDWEAKRVVPSPHAPTGHRPEAQGWPEEPGPTLGLAFPLSSTPTGLRPGAATVCGNVTQPP